MTLKQWAENRWLRSHKTSRTEISSLLKMVDRDVKDATSGISADWRFGIAYNAVVRLCTILLDAEGYRPERTLQHYRTIQALPLILGGKRKDDAEYLNTCRSKRNILEYDYVGGVSDLDADELIEFVKVLKRDVVEWLKNHHPELA